MSKPPAPKRISKSVLENAALRYLERFASSAANLRRVLLRRVDRAARHFGDDPAAGEALVDELIGRYLAAGLLDDRQYALGKSRSLLRRGTSLRGIRHHLASRGIADALITVAVDDLRAEAEGGAAEIGTSALDVEAAYAYARRRRLGPYRSEELRAATRLRDLAALGRAGFPFEVAKLVVDGDPR